MLSCLSPKIVIITTAALKLLDLSHVLWAATQRHWIFRDDLEHSIGVLSFLRAVEEQKIGGFAVQGGWRDAWHALHRCSSTQEASGTGPRVLIRRWAAQERRTLNRWFECIQFPEVFSYLGSPLLRGGHRLADQLPRLLPVADWKNAASERHAWLGLLFHTHLVAICSIVI